MNKLTTVFLKVAGAVAVAGVIASMGYQRGHDVGQAEEAERNLKAITQLEEKIVVKNQALADLAKQEGQAAQEAEEKIRVVYRDKVKEVIKYVEKNPAESSDRMGAEWVRLHDRFAAEGRAEASAPTDGTDEARARVTKADAISVIGDNYRLYHECADRLHRLQNFHAKQMDTANAATP